MLSVNLPSLALDQTSLYFSDRNSGWKLLPENMPTARIVPAVAAFEGKIYVFGGLPKESQGYYDPVIDGDTFEILKTATVYEISSGKWQDISSLPDGEMFGAKTAVYENKIYIIGGRAFNQISPPAMAAPARAVFNIPTWQDRNVLPVWRRIWAYDPLSDTYEHVTDIPSETRALIAYDVVIVDHILYLIGGSDFGPCGNYGIFRCRCHVHKTVIGFDLSKRLWMLDIRNLVHPRKSCCSFYDGHTIQVVGGHDEQEYKSATQFLAIDEFGEYEHRWASIERAPMGATFQSVQCSVPHSMICKVLRWNKQDS